MIGLRKTYESLKSVWKTCWKLRNDDYTSGKLLNFPYHQNYYKLIDTDLSRQTNTRIPQQINFIGNLEEDDGEVMIFIAEK